jgi:protocadherin delta 1
MNDVQFVFPVCSPAGTWFPSCYCFFIQTANGNSETVLEYRIEEERPAGEYVGDVARDFGFDQELPVSTFSALRFSFLTLPTAGDRMYFTIDERTGVVRTSAVIDREEVCPLRTSESTQDGATDESCTIKFDVAVRPIEHFRIIKVRVEIIDTNDNAPVFSPDFLPIDVSEAADTGTSFALPAAEGLGQSAVRHIAL